MCQTPRKVRAPQEEENYNDVGDSESSYEDAPSEEQPDINNLLTRLSPERKSTSGNRSQYRADFETFLKSHSLGRISKEYLKNMFLKNDTHNTYGPYYEFDNLKLGNKPIFFSAQDKMFVGNQGETPERSLVSPNDLTVYKNIILQTKLA